MTIRSANTINPPTMLPRTTNGPKAGTIAPAPLSRWPCVRMRRVALTSSERRKSVASSSAGANAENSSGSSTRRLIRSTSAEPKMSMPSSTSRIGGGSGTIRIATIDSTAAAKIPFSFMLPTVPRG